MAEIRINKEQWDAVSPAEQQKIVTGLRESGALAQGDIIVGDPSVAPMTADTPLAPMWNPIKDLCKAACDVAATGGLAWCAANTVGLGLAACIAAAEIARSECKKRC